MLSSNHTEHHTQTAEPVPVPVPEPVPEPATEIPQEKPTLKTEDTGKIFEKAICDSVGIPYDGPFKYSQEEVDKLVPRLSKILTENLFPPCIHTAKKGARYDFTSLDGKMHLSAKSNKKKGGKLAAQVIGQATPTKFCTILGIEYTTKENLKQHIQENISSILSVLWGYTFDSQLIYYVKDTNTIRFITPRNSILSATATATTPVNWSEYQYTWTLSYDKWEGSSSVSITIDGKKEPILEWQFHKNRKNMAIRWSIENILRIFSDQFDILDL
jgi:hypothetical protein